MLVIRLTGISLGTRSVTAGLDQVDKQIVLENWLARLITQRVPMSGFADALHKNQDDVKTVVDLGE